MKIYVQRIPPEGEVLRGAEPVSILDVVDENVRFEEEIRYDFFAQVQGQSLLVTGKIETPVTLRCGRCLKIFKQPVTVGQFVVHQELSGEDFVDLTDSIREDILLQLPQRALCQENCRGLCIRCGVDLNESTCRCDEEKGDMRWYALDQIKLK